MSNLTLQAAQYRANLRDLRVAHLVALRERDYAGAARLRREHDEAQRNAPAVVREEAERLSVQQHRRPTQSPTTWEAP